MKAASKLGLMGVWVVAGSLVLSPANSKASETNGFCGPAGKQPTQWSTTECEILRSIPVADRSVVYQDDTQTVLVLKSSVVRSGSIVEARVIFDRYSAVFGRAANEAPRSESRLQRIDCASQQQAVVERISYDKPVARGLPSAEKREQVVAMSPIKPATVEARVAAVLCTVAKEG